MAGDSSRTNPQIGAFWTFVPLGPFEKAWLAHGLDWEKHLWDLEMTLMHGPRAGKVIPGTVGIRKLRYSPRHWNVGKSGALRVLYVLFEETRHIVLCYVYPKTESDDISHDVKVHLNMLVETARARLLAKGKRAR